MLRFYWASSARRVANTTSILTYRSTLPSHQILTIRQWRRFFVLKKFIKSYSSRISSKTSSKRLTSRMKSWQILAATYTFFSKSAFQFPTNLATVAGLRKSKAGSIEFSTRSTLYYSLNPLNAACAFNEGWTCSTIIFCIRKTWLTNSKLSKARRIAGRRKVTLSLLLTRLTRWDFPWSTFDWPLHTGSAT